VLCGGDGNDLLIGGSGRSVLIGDRGLDRLVGNPGDDILIGGTTLYSSDHAALCEILEEWSRKDLSYSERVRRLSSGAFALTSATVIDDGAFDLLTGAAGNDWFFAEAIDKVTDQKNFEIIS
jgi:Ca2+-binding RTX toxin-like protein